MCEKKFIYNCPLCKSARKRVKWQKNLMRLKRKKKVKTMMVMGMMNLKLNN